MKLLIVSNAGCGKTHLAKRLAKQKGLKLFHMDDIWFKPGGYSAQHERTKAERDAIVAQIKKHKSYIIEGASGITARQFLHEATHLIFIKYPWPVCKESILTRTLPKGQVSTKEQTTGLAKWASGYYKRSAKESVSMQAHQKIFDDFKGSKYILVSREDANNLCI